MRNAETVLGVIYARGRQGLPLEDIYRQLFNRDLYLRAYGRLYRNDGAMTPGMTAETVDGMSLAKIDAIIDDIRHERYRWTPVRRTYVPKKTGKLRPLSRADRFPRCTLYRLPLPWCCHPAAARPASRPQNAAPDALRQ